MHRHGQLMSGIPGAWHYDEYFVFGYHKGIRVSIHVPADGSAPDAVTHYFERANRPFAEALERHLPAVLEAFAEFTTSGILRFRRQAGQCREVKHSIMLKPMRILEATVYCPPKHEERAEAELADILRKLAPLFKRSDG